MTYDYIIAGAGSAACVLANRLTAASLARKARYSRRARSSGCREGLQDHFYVRTMWKCAQPITFNDDVASLMGHIAVGLRYAQFRRGPLTVSAGYAGAFVKTRGELPRPDVQLYFINFSTDKMGTTLLPHSGFTVSMWPLRPQSRGFVRIRSADPR